MKKILLILLNLYSFSLFSKPNYSKHPIYNQILKNKPTIDKSYAFKLSNIIHKMTRKYKIPSNLYTAILMQESSYKLKAMNCTKGMNIELETELKVCTDFGISQIYYKTAKRFKFDTNRLITDLEYSVEAGLIVLNDFRKRYSNKDIDWYVRYNCGSKGTTKRNTCVKYKKLIERFM